MPPKLSAAASRSVSTGKTSSSSYLRANGIISSRAKARAVSFIARCSSVSSKSIAATDNGSACERQSSRMIVRSTLTIDHVRDGRRNRLRCLVDVLHDTLYRIAGNRIDLQFHSLCFSEKTRILHRIHEGVTQRRRALRGNAGGRQKWPSHWLASKDQLEDLPLLLGFRKIHDQRNIRQIGMLVEGQLHQDVDLFFIQPGLVSCDDARPRPAASPHHFAAFHCQVDVITAGIAGDDLELGMQRGIENLGKLIGISGWTRSPDCQLFVHDVLKLGDAARVPGDTDADFIVHAADPVELGRIELSLRGAEQGIESSTASDHAECGAVLGPDVVKPVGEHEATGTRHVLRHDGRITRNEAPHVTRECSSIDVVSAPGAVADVKIDRLALVEARQSLRMTQRGRAERQNRGGTDNCPNTHVILPSRPCDDPLGNGRCCLRRDPCARPRPGDARSQASASVCLADKPPFAVESMEPQADGSNRSISAAFMRAELPKWAKPQACRYYGAIGAAGVSGPAGT